MGKYISKKILKKTLGTEKFSVLENSAIDVTENFLTGQITNALNYADSLTYFKSLSGYTAQLMGTVKTIYDSISSGEIESITKDIIEDTVTRTVSEVSKYAASKATDLIPTTYDISYGVTYWFNYYKKPAGDIIKKLVTPVETQIDKQTQSDEEKRLQEFKTKAQDMTTSIQKVTYAVSSSVGDAASEVSCWVLKGPEWTVRQLDNIIDKGVSASQKEIDTKYEYIKKRRNDFVENETKKIGKKAAGIYNNALEKAEKKVRDALSLKNTQAKVKAFTELQAAKLAIMARFGINIPVTGSIVKI